MREHDDESTMERIAAGETGLLEGLFHRHRRPLLAYIARVVRDRDAAEDVLQEAFLRVHLRRHTYRPGGRFRAWLYKIALNLARDHLRRRSRAREMPLEVAVSDGSTHGDPWSRLHRSTTRRQVACAVRQLPERQREVLVLYRYHGYSYPDISRLCRVPLGTVKSRLHHAMARLSTDLVALEAEVS